MSAFFVANVRFLGPIVRFQPDTFVRLGLKQRGRFDRFLFTLQANDAPFSFLLPQDTKVPFARYSVTNDAVNVDNSLGDTAGAMPGRDRLDKSIFFEVFEMVANATNGERTTGSDVLLRRETKARFAVRVFAKRNEDHLLVDGQIEPKSGAN